MKNLLLSFLLLSTSAIAQDTWVQRDSINGPGRSAAVSFVINEEGWIATGYDGFDESRRMYSYDLEQDDWDDEVSLGGDTGSGLKRKSSVGFNAGELGFVALGSGIASYFKDVWQYDDEVKVWTQMADFPGEARREAVAFSVDTVAYVGSGVAESGLMNDFYKFDAWSNSWTAIATFPGEPRREAVGFDMGGQCLFGTGRSDSGFLTDFWEYIPATDSWNQLADFPGSPRAGASGCGRFPLAYIMLGEDNAFEYKNDVWEYNYFSNTWTQKADFPGPPRAQAVAFTVQNRIFCGSGYGGEWYDDFYEYEYVLSDGIEVETIDFDLFPNPATDYFTLQFAKQPSEVLIQDSQGKVVFSKRVSDQSGSMNIDLSDFTPSTYFVSLNFESGEKLVKKLIVQ